MLDALEGALNGSIESKNSGKRHIQANLLLGMLKIDRERALTSMKLWARFWFAVVTFGMAITIPEEEMDLCRRLMRPAWIVAGLTNDLFSWQKEYEASLENGQSHVVNAIWVLMREHSITVDKAKDLCRQKIKQHIAEYVRVVKETRNNMDLSLDLRKYIDCMQYSLSGNVVWSRLCPRYHPTASYNELQLARMKCGVERYPVKPYEFLEVSDTQLTHSIGASSSSAVEVIEIDPPSTNGHDWNKDVNGVHDVKGVNQVNGDSGLAKVNGTNGVEPKASTPMVHTETIEDLVIERNLPMLSDKVVLAPYEYISSLPSKGVREQAIDAFNVWVKAPLEPLNIIKSTIGRLHNASLMLDDLEDMSPLRRGRPSTHTIFGDAQTINAANYQIIEALSEYTKQKGFGEDLDEGKYSLPLIHTLYTDPQNMPLRGVLLQRRAAGQSTFSHKQFVLEQMKRTKSLKITASLLKTLHDEIGHEIDRVEEA